MEGGKHMNEISARTPQIIAAEIHGIKGQARTVMLVSSMEIGRRLIEAKALLSHGEWGKWLQDSVDYSQSTANNLMQLYREYGTDVSKFPTLGNLSYTKAIALLGVPAEEREEFAETNDIESKSAREIQRLIKERDKALEENKELNSRLATTKETVTQIAAECDTLREEKAILQSDVRNTTQVLKDTQDTVRTLQDALEEERSRAKSDVERLTELLSEAREDGTPDARVQELQAELLTAQAQVDKLTEQMNAPITLEPTVVEKIPEEVERELAELRQKAQELESQAPRESPAVHKYAVYFEALVSGFKSLLGALAEIQEADPATHEKYRGAVVALIGKMSERL